MKHTIAIADDHALFRKGLSEIIHHFNAYSVVFDVETGEELLLQLATQLPDIVLLDLKMPGMGGIETLKRIRESYSSLKVIVLSMHDEERFILHAFQHGVNGYLLKNTDPERLEEILNIVIEDGIYLSDNVSKILARAHSKRTYKPTFKTNLLTEREKQVLDLITKGMTNAQIGVKLYLSKRTIDGHRQMLLEKTETKNSPELVAWAFRNGLVE